MTFQGNFSMMYNGMSNGMGSFTKTSTGSLKGTSIGSLSENCLEKDGWWTE